MDNESKKSELVKMIELDPVLVDLIAEHQFEKLLFSFHTLPMTVSCPIIRQFKCLILAASTTLDGFWQMRAYLLTIV
jgi:hypothetical protein